MVVSAIAWWGGFQFLHRSCLREVEAPLRRVREYSRVDVNEARQKII